MSWCLSLFSVELFSSQFLWKSLRRGRFLVLCSEDPSRFLSSFGSFRLFFVRMLGHTLSSCCVCGLCHCIFPARPVYVESSVFYFQSGDGLQFMICAWFVCVCFLFFWCSFLSVFMNVFSSVLQLLASIPLRCVFAVYLLQSQQCSGFYVFSILCVRLSASDTSAAVLISCAIKCD